jgi:hypothetical protein
VLKAPRKKIAEEIGLSKHIPPLAKTKFLTKYGTFGGEEWNNHVTQK